MRDLPNELCGPPNIPRLYPPPHQYMLDNQHGTPDQLGVNDRTSDFYRDPNNHNWTQYIATLPPMVRRYYNTLPPSRYDYLPHAPTPTTTKAPRLGGYSRTTTPTLQQTTSRKRHRTTPPTSDSDPGGYSRNNQPYDEPSPTQTTHAQQPSAAADSKRNSEEEHYGRSNSGNRPRFAHEDKSTPHLRPCLTARAANRRAATIRDWFNAHKGPINPRDTQATDTPIDLPSPSRKQSTLKDPAQPHPNDLPNPHPPSLTIPAEQRSLTTVTNLGGYTSHAPSPVPLPCLSAKRPSLTSILKNHRAEKPTTPLQTSPPRPQSQSAQTHISSSHIAAHSDPPTASLPNPQHRHLFQPIFSPRHTIIPRPYIAAPQPRDIEGQPWCSGCTAQLSDDDTHSLGLRDIFTLMLLFSSRSILQRTPGSTDGLSSFTSQCNVQDSSYKNIRSYNITLESIIDEETFVGRSIASMREMYTPEIVAEATLFVERDLLMFGYAYWDGRDIMEYARNIVSMKTAPNCTDHKLFYEKR